MFLYTYNTALPSTVTRVKILPDVVSANANLRSLKIEERDCRFPEEGEDMTIFKEYSSKGCVFECMLHLARETCGCTPWNYPHPPGIQHTNIRAHFILYTIYSIIYNCMG